MHSHTHMHSLTHMHSHTHALTHTGTTCPRHLQTPLCKRTYFLKLTCAPQISTRGAFPVFCGRPICCHQCAHSKRKLNKATPYSRFSFLTVNTHPLCGRSSITFFASLPFLWLFCLKCPQTQCWSPEVLAIGPKIKKSCDVLYEENEEV